MDIPIPEPSDRVLRRRSKINYKEPEEDDLFIIEENPLMPSVVLQEPAPARVTYSSRPRKLSEQPAASPSPDSEGRAEESALDNSLMAAKSGASGETTPRILKRGDPIPKAFDLNKPAKQSAAQEFVPLPTTPSFRCKQLWAVLNNTTATPSFRIDSPKTQIYKTVKSHLL